MSNMAARAPRESEEIFRSQVWSLIPGLIINLWYGGKTFIGGAIEQIGWIRRGLDALETKLKEEIEAGIHNEPR